MPTAAVKRASAVAVVVALLAPGAPAVAQPAEAPVAPPQRAVLVGRVVHADGTPAAGATLAIEASGGELTRAETTAHGPFRVAELAAGAYSVTVVGAGGEQTELRVEVAPGARPIEIRLPGNAAGETIEVRGLSAAAERRQSTDAVTVVETDQARRASADLGEVLARTKGVSMRRSGGLGSGAALSLAGLSGEQIRFFLDGVPLDLAGFPFGVANVPVNLIDRIEVYSGVVPVRFGADALGGAVNLVTTDGTHGAHGSASYEAGSFDTDRLALSARYRAASGWYGRVDGFLDHARNDYAVDVRESDETGQLTDARVHRFHDGYTAGGGSAELGVLDRPWARRLALRGFASGYDKQYQNDPTMQRVYGAVGYDKRAAGATARYAQGFGALAVDGIAGYVFSRGRFLDVSPCVYNWFGRCIVMTQPGEIGNKPVDERTWDHTAFARLFASWTLDAHHALRLAIAPTYTTRSGDDRQIVSGRDPLSADRTLGTLVSGLEHQLDLFGGRLQNVAFVKHYAQRLASEDPQPGGAFLRRDRHSQHVGLGDAARLRLGDALYAKASYEWATRLPSAGEVFGDNAFINPNLLLDPEVSHNGNVGLALDGLATRAGVISAAATGFVRRADQLIEPFSVTSDQTYQNVAAARSLGVEAAAAWASPGDHVVIDGTAMYQSFRNNSAAGPYGTFDGERIPNQPYLTASGGARVQLRDQIMRSDELTLGYGLRYTHAFDRDWSSLGAEDARQVIPTQWLHHVTAGYRVRGPRVDLSTTLEVTNLSDAPAYDYFRVQRPGRAFHVKTSVAF